MSTKLVQPPIHFSQVVPTTPIITKMMRRPHTTLSTTQSKKKSVIGQYPNGQRLIISSIKAAELSFDSNKTSEQLKIELCDALQGTNRGIFGVPTEKKSEIEDCVKLLESQNPTQDPTLHLEKVAGCWKLVYSTIRILGSKRTKLRLRDFFSLGDFLQIIDVAKGKAVNVIKFNAKGLSLFNGKLRIDATFKRVDIRYRNSSITPDQLMNLFRKNYDVLLGIFNPDGWLEITYVDDTLRIGRDDKGNVFILERSEDENL